jgi:hypothetical protein
MRPIPPDLHPLVRKALRALKPNPRYPNFANDTDDGLLRSPHEFLAVAVAPEEVERAGRLLDTIVRMLEGAEIGAAIVIEKERPLVAVGDDRFRFRLKQVTNRSDHRPTPAEQRNLKEHPYGHTVPKWDWRATDRFVLEIADPDPSYGRVRATLSDGKRGRLEEKLARLPGIIQSLIQANREHEAENERRRRQWEEEERIRREAAERAKREQEAREELFAQAERWRRASALRQYLAAVEAVIRGRAVPETDAAWDRLAWARAIADELDPLSPTTPMAPRQ